MRVLNSPLDDLLIVVFMNIPKQMYTNQKQVTKELEAEEGIEMVEEVEAFVTPQQSVDTTPETSVEGTVGV